jgi:hypothetical protein
LWRYNVQVLVEIRKINLIKNKKEVEAEVFFTNKQALKKAKEKNNLFYKNTFLSVVSGQDKSSENKQKLVKNRKLLIEEEEKEISDDLSEKEYSNFIKEYKQFLKAKNKNSLKSKVMIS